jgi:hypothetical protein
MVPSLASTITKAGSKQTLSLSDCYRRERIDAYQLMDTFAADDVPTRIDLPQVFFSETAELLLESCC